MEAVDLAASQIVYASRRISRWLGRVIAGLGIAVLFAWILNLPTLTSLLPGLATMKFNTALLFVFCSVSLIAIIIHWPRVHIILAAASTAIALLTLLQYAFGIDLGIDEWLIQDSISAAQNADFPGRMSIMSAINFVLIGVSLLLVTRRPVIAQILSLLTAFLSLLALTGYLFGVEALYDIFAFASMALHTAAAFLALSAGILLLQPTTILMLVITSRSAGGLLMRNLIPAVIFVPLILGWLQLQGQALDLYANEFGTALATMLNIVVFIGIVWWTAHSLHNVDKQRIEAEDALQKSHDELEVRVIERTTELARANQELQDSETRFRTLLDSAPDAMIIVNQAGEIILVNAQVEALFGFDRDELLGQQIEMLIPEPYHERHPSHREEYVKDPHVRAMGQGLDLFALRKDGSQFPVEISLSPIARPEGYVTAAAVRDITQRRRVEEGLAQLAAIVRASDDAIMGINPQGIIMSWNPAAERMYGYTSDDMVGQAVKILVPPEQLEEARQIIDTVKTGERVPAMETVRLRKDGTLLEVALTVSPITDSDGKVIGIASISRDISDRKRQEASLQRYSQALESSNRELEMFAYTASHDLQEPLRKIQAFGGRLEVMSSDILDETAKDYLTRIISASNRMQTLIQDMLSYSRVTTKGTKFVKVQLNAVLDQVCNDLEVTIQKTGATVEVPELATIEGDETQLRQLFQNLISNALKFRLENRAPVIQFSGEMLIRSQASAFITDRHDRSYELTIRDNGIGFDEKYAERIFGMFQRLHGRNEYQGTGIGLAICQKIVERHRGTIEAHGTPGEGATFVITLPVNQSQEQDKV